MTKSKICLWIEIPLRDPDAVKPLWRASVGIDATEYDLELCFDGPVTCVQLTKTTFARKSARVRVDVYQLRRMPGERFSCDCPASQFNHDAACKHSNCMAELLKQLADEYGDGSVPTPDQITTGESDNGEASGIETGGSIDDANRAFDEARDDW